MPSPTSNNNNNNTDTDDRLSDFSPLPVFTSGDAHNGCRALFNGTAGWAFFGTAGFIDPTALPPGTESYPCDFKTTSTKKARPGEGLGRKTNDARSAYLDAEDLGHLVRGTWEADAVEEGGREGVEGGAAALRKGRPIVLTLQAILAATSPSSPAAAAIEAAAAVAATGARVEDYERARRPPESSGSEPPPVAIADRAEFPPLMLRGASADKGPGLFLAPPITMVKKNAAAQAADHQADAEAPVAGMQNGDGGVSCSEAVAATSIAEAAAHGGGSGGGDEASTAASGGGMSRIGWWLRWATTSTGGNATEGDVVGGGDVVSLEMSAGVDGWQVVSTPASGASPAAAAADASPAAASDSDDEEGSWCHFAVEEEEAGVGGMIHRAPPAVAIEDALKRAASGNIYDEGALDEESCSVAPGAEHGDKGVPQAVSPNVPLSFRDTLMAPSATGAVRFSDSEALLKAQASATGATSAKGLGSVNPTLVDGGVDGGAVLLWKKAAAGDGRTDRFKDPVEDEDPYYARKRVGAFAFKTKPRGKAHK
eukprot:g12979.t1